MDSLIHASPATLSVAPRPALPRDASLDSTLALLREGYCFMLRRFERYRSDIFAARLLLRPVLCLRGAEAALLFYDPARFQRQGAMPARGLKTLLGRGGVQTLDGEAHRWRKQMFMGLMGPARLRQLSALVAGQWRAHIDQWTGQERVVLFDEVRELLCRSVCRWAEVPLPEADVARRTRDLGALIDSPAALGFRYWRGRLARWRCERWAGMLIREVRQGHWQPAAGSALHAIAWHRDLNGRLLDVRTAAVELINVLRPVVALAHYIVFIAHALHERPEYRPRLQHDDEGELENFVQEVRRFYPFFPFVAAIVREDFDWQGVHFPQGRRVLLDLYATNHDPRAWVQPEEFWPERFRQWSGSAYNFIPQGGGDYERHHRCAGEWLTLELMKTATRQLVGAMSYTVPAQDLSISLRRMPALPASGFVIGEVRALWRPVAEAGGARPYQAPPADVWL